MSLTASIQRVAARHWIQKYAGPLTDVSKLKHQAVFLMGAPGSGKTFVAYRWLKYMPGGGGGGVSRKDFEDIERGVTHGVGLLPPDERSLANLSFERAVDALKRRGITIEVTEGGRSAQVPFELYYYVGNEGNKIPRREWETSLPADILHDVKELEKLVFSTPVHELPSYWRQVGGDVYKPEIPGYREKLPGYVHEMSSTMARAYFIAAAETGDPMIVDGTGSNLAKMDDQIRLAKEYGYRTSLVLVWVPLTINHIRNATRSRNMDPDAVTAQWRLIQTNFRKLRSMVDKAVAVDNRNDARDLRIWEARKDEINAFIARRSSYPNLCALLNDAAPNELSNYPMICPSGKYLRPR